MSAPVEKVKAVVKVAGKTAIGQIPVAGPFLLNAIAEIKSQQLEKRLKNLENQVEELAGIMNVSQQALLANPASATALLYMVRLSLETGSEEKRRLLVVGFFNSCRPAFDEEKIVLMYDLLAKYVPLHIDILRYIDGLSASGFGPKDIFGKPDLNPTGNVMVHFSQRGIDEAYIKKVHQDLVNDFLVYPFATSQPLLTRFGKDFLEFLSDNQTSSS